MNFRHSITVSFLNTQKFGLQTSSDFGHFLYIYFQFPTNIQFFLVREMSLFVNLHDRYQFSGDAIFFCCYLNFFVATFLCCYFYLLFFLLLFLIIIILLLLFLKVAIPQDGSFYLLFFSTHNYIIKTKNKTHKNALSSI